MRPRWRSWAWCAPGWRRSGTARASSRGSCCPYRCPTTTASSTARSRPASPGISATCSKTSAGSCSERRAREEMRRDRMSTEIRIPDIGDFKQVPVIEIHVAPGDKIAVEDPLVTLESDKATMDVPAPQAGTVGDVRIKVGDRVSEGDVILTLEAEGEPAIPPKERVSSDAAPSPAEPPGYGSPSGVYDTIEVRVPDIGDFKQVPVIEIHVASGAEIKPEDPLITLESDKATMDVPAPAAGTVADVKVKTGDRVSEGDLILTLRTGAAKPAGAAIEMPRAPAPAARPPVAAQGDVHAEVLVLGAGPGGYTAAFRAADLGKRVVLVERWPTLG